MASIIKRLYPSGVEVYRVFFRKRGRPSYCLTVDSKHEAKEFVNMHEEEYLMNPESFVQDKKHLRNYRVLIRKLDQLKI